MKDSLLMLMLGTMLIAMTGLAYAEAAPSATAAAPIATADGETSGMQVQVKSLKRTGGDALLLQFVIINNSDNSFGVSGTFLPPGEMNRTDVSGVNLVDVAGKKKYEVIRDADKNCLCSRDFSGIPSKGSLNLYAKFPAPPDSVQKIEVNVPHFMPMEDVPISQ
jgi:hypothetical protein